MHSFLMGAVTKYKKLDGLEQWKLTVTHFSGWEVQIQSVGRVMVPLIPVEESACFLFADKQVFGVPLLIDTSLCLFSS